VRWLTRDDLDWADRRPALARAIATLPVQTALFGGDLGSSPLLERAAWRGHAVPSRARRSDGFTKAARTATTAWSSSASGPAGPPAGASSGRRNRENAKRVVLLPSYRWPLSSLYTRPGFA